MTAVEEPVDCPNVSRIACKYASIFQEFLQHSGLPIWNRFKNTGFWRQLTVGAKFCGFVHRSRFLFIAILKYVLLVTIIHIIFWSLDQFLGLVNHH